MREILNQISYWPRVVRLVWSASRGHTLAWAALLVVQGSLPAALVYMSRLLVDGLVATIGAGASWESIKPVAAVAVVMVGILLLMELLNSAAEWIRSAQSELVQDHLSALVHEKSISVDLAFYEMPEFHDRLERARSDAGTRCLALLENAGRLLQNGITLLAMASLVIPYGLWVPLVLLASVLPAFFVVIRSNRRHHQWWNKTTQARRWTKYYDTMLTHSGVAPELRIFDLGPGFQAAFQALRGRLREERLSLSKRQSMAHLGAGLAALLISGVAIAWMVWRALSGLVTLGDLALFYQAFSRGQALMRTLLSSVGQIYANSLFLGNLFEFLDLKPKVVDPEHPTPTPSTLLSEGIRLRNVSFRYPGSQQLALKDFSLTIPAGRTVAIVGPNGAGKSTLLKLLCRFYDPDAGSVEFDGIDIRNFPIAELRRRISVLLQFPVYYHATAAQNIAMGGPHPNPPPKGEGKQVPSPFGGGLGWGPPSAREIEAAARAAGAHEFIARLPQGYDTLLGKWFADGVELSGGEWQRLALARAFVRKSPVIILDEPTSFMDSWAESEWLERFRDLARERTAIVITHRFTTAMRADLIYVMDQGHIIESGTHDELVTQGGLYASSWAAQVNASLKSPEKVTVNV
jgi:ATP-binding cassette subfamily B protein